MHRPEIALTRFQLAELLLAHYPDEKKDALEHLDFAVIYIMHYTVKVTEHRLSQDDLFHQTGDIGYPCHITSIVLVLYDDKDTGYQVSYQILSTKLTAIPAIPNPVSTGPI